MFFPLLPPGFRTDTANLFFFPDFRHGFFLLRLFLIIIVNIDDQADYDQQCNRSRPHAESIVQNILAGKNDGNTK